MTPDADIYPHDLTLDEVWLKDGRAAFLKLNVSGHLVDDEIDREPEDEEIESVEDLEFWGRLYFEDGSTQDVLNGDAFWDLVEKSSFSKIESEAEEFIFGTNK